MYQARSTLASLVYGTDKLSPYFLTNSTSGNILPIFLFKPSRLLLASTNCANALTYGLIISKPFSPFNSPRVIFLNRGSYRSNNPEDICHERQIRIAVVPDVRKLQFPTHELLSLIIPDVSIRDILRAEKDSARNEVSIEIHSIFDTAIANNHLTTTSPPRE